VTSLLAESRSPLISVVIPVRNSPEELRHCLERLHKSTFSDHEIIVVDDASTDTTAAVAAEFGVHLLHLEKKCGPAVARNRGAQVAQGEVVFFLDADVGAYPDTLERVAETFTANPEVDAVFGSYDDRPAARNVLSEYKNLFHHFVHQDSKQEATTFWSGCGAVRRSVFLDMGGFDSSYRRPCIEDIELGVRLHNARHKIVLNKRIQVTHLKRWSLWSMVKTDVVSRGIPWTELMMREGNMPNDLNLKYSQRISVILAYGLLGVLGVGVWYIRHMVALPFLLLAVIAALDYWSVRRRFPTLVRILAGVAGLGVLALIGYTFKFWPLLPFALVVGIMAVNFRFYWFFFRQRRLLLATLVLPLHVLYYLYCGLAFGLGVTSHVWKTKILRHKKHVPEPLSSGG